MSTFHNQEFISPVDVLVNVTLWGASPSDDEKVKLATGAGISSPPLSVLLLSSVWEEVVEPPEHETINK